MGTTFAVLSLSGKTPFERLRLNIWASGTFISVIIFLIRYMLIPSTSVLFLESRVFTMSEMWMGPVVPKSRVGVLGLTGRYSLYFLVVGLILFAISVPIFVKKLLNSFEILKGSVRIFPFALIFSIWLFTVCPKVASLITSQVFLGFFLFALL